jgi:integrase
MAIDFDERRSRCNARLKNAGLGVSVQQVGKRLYIQANLPPKPGGTRVQSHQQKIPTRKPATGAGLDAAEKLAKRLAGELIAGSFRWEDWLEFCPDRSRPPIRVGEWVEAYTRRNRPSVAASTWRTDYANVFGQLPKSEPLTAELLERAILSKPMDSAQRKRFAQTLGRLAKFAGLDSDFRSLRGKYSASAVQPRDIPSDAAIVAAWRGISHPGWAWCFGMMAAFGLRNHEVFFVDLEQLKRTEPYLTVESGKTGEHQSWAFHPEWVDLFRLRTPVLPFTQRYPNHEDYGRRVSNEACKHWPFSPYNLRHAWAIRTVLYGLPDSIAAQMMGHSVEVHQRTYQHWLGQQHQQQAYERVMGRSDRPRPPLP